MINGRRIIALCLSKLGEVPSFQLTTSLNAEAQKLGHSVFVYNLCEDLFYADTRSQTEARIFDLIDFSIVDVLVISVEGIKHKPTVAALVLNAQEHGVPVITIDGYFEGCINLGFGFKEGFEKIVRHITDFHGITDIHYIAGFKGNSFSEERRKVIEDVLAEKGIEFTEENVSYGDFWGVPAKQAAIRLIESGRLPKAIICANDIMAINVCTVLTENGINVPDDVLVTGFDGIEDILFSLPRITSASCSLTLMGKKVAETADEIFRTGKFTGSTQVIPELMPSNSCGCCDDKTINVPSIMSLLSSRFNRIQDDNHALSKCSEKMQNCRSIEEVSALFDNYVFSDTTCLLNKRFTVPTAKPFVHTEEDIFEDEMCVLHNFGSLQDYKPFNFHKNNIIPEIDRLLEKKCPLVFSMIDYLNTPLGYVIFHYPTDDLNLYCRIPIIITALNNALGGYINNQSQRYLLFRVEEMYRTDPLTGLFNRIGFSNEFERRFGNPNTSSITVVLADLDNLKYINDKFGHMAGDKAIRMVADALQYACPEDSLFVRLGGDEMMAVMGGAPQEESIKNSISFFLEKNSFGFDYNVSSSIGVYSTDKPEEMRIESLIKHSDELMYSEKRRKKDSARR